MSTPGELTIMGCFIIGMVRWCFAKNANDIKEWDAPELNKTIAG
jgi:hypothetical protein